MTGYSMAAIDSWLDPKYKLELKTIFDSKIVIFYSKIPEAPKAPEVPLNLLTC